MTQATSITTQPAFRVRQWARIPVAIRAIVGGVLVFSILQFGWNALIVLNVQTTPAIPWNVPLGLLYLWVVFQFFNGRWAPASTRQARRESMRARRLSGDEWRATLVASVPVMVFVTSFLLLTVRLFAIQGDELGLETLPWWTHFSTLIMISIVAGVSEEAGFRGYMQAPLEKRYGPAMAIAITGVLFWALHLNHPSVWARVLSLVGDRPGERAGDLDEAVGEDQAALKSNVRKLKSLGLTESLSIRYRLSPRGEAILSRVRATRDGSR